MKNASHPVWSLAKLGMLLVFLVVFSWINASQFDETELKVIGWVMGLYGGVEFISNKLEKRE